jgi:transposase
LWQKRSEVNEMKVKVDKDKLKKILIAKQDGVSNKDIATRFGLSVSHVWALIKDNSKDVQK